MVVAAYRVSSLPLSQIVDTHPSVYYIMKNAGNQFIATLYGSFASMLTQINSSMNSNLNTFLYILIASSCCLLFSLLFMIPVINKVRKNKQEVLELFTHRNIEKHIDDQLKVLRGFI